MNPLENARALFFEGLELMGRGDHAGAESRFSGALELAPDRPSILTNLAAVELQLGRIESARQHAQRAAELEPETPGAWMNLAQAELQGGRHEAAMDALRRVTGLEPDNAGAWALLAAQHDRCGQHPEAAEAYARAVALQPGRQDWLSNLGAIYNDLRRFDEALDCHERSLAIEADQPGTLSNKANSLHELRRYEEALVAHGRALVLAPDYAQGWSNKAGTLHALGRHAEALAAHERALQLQPDYAEGWSGKAGTLRALRRFDEALAACERALRLAPESPGALANKALILHDRRRFDEALALYDRALAGAPGDADAWFNRGVTLHELHRHEEAAASFERALALKPDAAFLPGMLLHAKMKICDWSGLDIRIRELFDGVARGERVSTPFQVLALGESEALNRRAAEIWARDRCPGLSPVEFPPRAAGDRIRVAYVSADFHNHAAAFLAAELFERHDRGRFEIIALSYGADRDDAMRRRLVAGFDRFIDVRERGDAEIAAMARDMGIDIAVDLKGHTEDSRLGIFAHRAAPVQVTYLGYPGTTAVEGIDYLIADPVVIPPGHRMHFSESVAWLPDCYQVNDSRREIAAVSFSRAELGLPQQGFVFCCFNNSYKITPAVFDRWMRILRAVDGSVLWLVDDNAAVPGNLRAEAERRGVAGDRLLFAPRMQYPQHLARQRAADLFLDTWPYNAHTTASDALFAGLPVLTWLGKTFPSRVAASLLRAAGLPELVADTPEAYEDLAVTLATRPGRLAGLRERLQRNRATAALFDGARTTRLIEDLYLQMVERQRAGLSPGALQAGAAGG